MIINKKISICLLYKKINYNIIHNNSFVIFKKPYLNKIFLYSHSSSHNNNNNNLFIFQDFTKKNVIKIIPKKIYYTDNINFILDKKKLFINNKYHKYDDKKYKKLIYHAVQCMKNNKKFKKVVLSKYIKIPYNILHIKDTFNNLICSYPNTFTYILYDSNFGIWIGCTPELLMKYENNKFYTESLAGTIWNNKKWNKKEFNEHIIVKNYIINTLKKFLPSTIFIDKIKVLKINFIQHLKTDIICTFSKQIHYNKLINKLYPTPSICGYPKRYALSFITQNEGYNRKFYTGYMGIIEKKLNIHNIELYINLRCAQIINNNIILYAGSGITIHSDIDQECLETNIKINVLLSKLFFN